MLPRTKFVLGRAPVSEKESLSLACSQEQGRIRSVRVHSSAIHHKVGCSWSAAADVDRDDSSAGPTTPPRFELSSRSTSAAQTGEPTVSHEGGNGRDSFSTFHSQQAANHKRVSEEKSTPLACSQEQGRIRSVRVHSSAIHHKVGCSWSAAAGGVLVDGSAGPTTPPRFEPSTRTPPAAQTGEPTVSHEGGNGFDFSSTFLPSHCPSAVLRGPAQPDLATSEQVSHG